MSVVVPPASCQIEVSSGEDSVPPAPPAPPPIPIKESPAHHTGGRAVVLVRRQSGPDGQVELTGSAGKETSPATSPKIKYVLTGLPGTIPLGSAGGTTLRSPVAHMAGESVKANRARQILKKRMTLNQMQKKYINIMRPDSNLPPEAPVAQTTPVMICEPEGGTTPKTGRTLFFVAKPPVGSDEPDWPIQSEEQDTAMLPDTPAGRGGAEGDSQAAGVPGSQTTEDETPGVLKTLAKYQLSEKYEILPPSNSETAEDIIHKLRCQNLALKTEMLKSAIDLETSADIDEQGLKYRRGRKKPTALVTVERLRELEKIEAGMHSLFTPSQVKTLSREYKKNSVQWKYEDFRRALGLLEMSSIRAFNYVRKEMLIPLPSIGTLKLRCPHHPELNVRFEAVLRNSLADPRCRTCSAQLTDQTEQLQQVEEQHEYQEEIIDHQPQHQEVVHQSWETPQRGVLRKRKRGGGSGGKKARLLEQQQQHQEPTVFFEDQMVIEHSPVRPRGGGRGRVRGGKRAPPPPEPEPDSESVSEEEFLEEYGDERVEIDEEQEVPPEYGRYPGQYAGWSEWDPRQLH